MGKFSDHLTFVLWISQQVTHLCWIVITRYLSISGYEHVIGKVPEFTSRGAEFFVHLQVQPSCGRGQINLCMCIKGDMVHFSCSRGGGSIKTFKSDGHLQPRRKFLYLPYSNTYERLSSNSAAIVSVCHDESYVVIVN